MPKINHEAVVPYSPAQMFALVSDVEKYPVFLPYCVGCEVHEKSDTATDATLHIDYTVGKEALRIRNTFFRENYRINLALVTGSMKHLQGCWELQPLQDGATRVKLFLHIKTGNIILNGLIKLGSDQVGRSLIDAFVAQARKEYEYKRALAL